MVEAPKPVASLSLLAARPVGAKRAIKSLAFLPFKFIYKSTIAFIMVVFPVPGPPLIIKMLFSNDLFIASF